MSTKYKFQNPEGLYFITWTIVDWVPVFSRTAYRDIVTESLNYCIRNKGLVVYAYVLMPDHIHLIAGVRQGFLLEDITRDFKRHTARNLLKTIQNESESRKEWMLHRFQRAGTFSAGNWEFKVWQRGSHAEELISNEWVMQKLNYIHQNPVRAGWVDDAEHYPHSSARDYAGQKGVVQVEFLY